MSATVLGIGDSGLVSVTDVQSRRIIQQAQVLPIMMMPMLTAVGFNADAGMNGNSQTSTLIAHDHVVHFMLFS